jgi:ACT domain-containing protein
MQTETWDDVINAIHAIMEYEKKKREENESPSKDDTQNESVDNDDDNEYDEDQTPSDEGDQEEDQDAKSSDNSNGSDTDEDENDTDSDDFEDSVEETGIPESETDNEYRKNEAEMIEKSMTNGIDHVQISQKNIDMAITDFAKLTELRKEVSPIPQHIIDEYKDFIKNNKKSIAPAVSQFNMCKSAYEYSRSKESKSGSISTQKLWSYKTNDDIFNRVTELATAKNHGLFILLDNSASMSSMISEIHLKLIQLLTFAKTVNIPFEVYSFTNRRDYQYVENLQVGDIYDTVALNQLSSSTLNKSQFEESLLRLYAKAHAYANRGFNGGLFDFIPPVERMDGTPMITSIVLLRQELKKFASKVEKPIFISMIDGDTSNLDYFRVHDGHYNVPKKLRIKVLNETIEMPIDTSWHSSKRNRRTAVNTFIKSLNYKTITILIRNGNRSPLQQNFIDECYSELNSTKRDLKMYIQKMIKKNGVAIFENTFGYDLVYMLQVEGAADEVEVEGQTRQELLKSFKGSFSNKKKSKVMMSHFGKFIA